MMFFLYLNSLVGYFLGTKIIELKFSLNISNFSMQLSVVILEIENHSFFLYILGL